MPSQGFRRLFAHSPIYQDASGYSIVSGAGVAQTVEKDVRHFPI
nr:MAG TPA: hypothetical protein [Caudoviricetes sp.]